MSKINNFLSLEENLMKSIYIKERLNMSNLSKRIKASVVLFAFVAYMPLAMLPSFAASVPGPDSIPSNTHPILDSSINGGYVGWHGGSESTANGKYDVNMDPNLGAGGVAQFDWGSFNVGKNVIVDWIFSNHSQTAINRVLNTGKMSQIYGKLTSSCGVGANCGDAGTNRTGNVILINPNGILFGAGSQVDLNSFTASTYDISGMKNIKDAIKDGYLGDTLKSDVQYTGVNNYKFNGDDKITANYKYGKRIAFNPGAIGADGNGIILESAGFNNVGDTKAKSVALVSNKIDINNSVIETYVSTGTQGNTLGSTKSQTDSNVKLVTADGVSFVYSNHGAIREDGSNKMNVAVKENAGANDGLKITGDSFIKSGSVQAVNGIKGKDIVIDNSTIESHKLYNGPSGTINIESAGNIDIKNSRLETLQAYDDVANVNNLKNYGNIDIAAAGNIKIDNTRIYSAPSNKNQGDKATVGNIKIESTGGNVEITKKAGAVNEQVKYTDENGNIQYAPVNIVSGGNTDILALNGDVIINLDGTSKIHADGYNKNGDLNIKGGDVEINNALLGGNNVMLSALSIQNGTGNLLGGGGLILNNSKVNAQNSLQVIGLNTTLADSNLSYNTIDFYNDYMDTHNLNNNVEIKNGTTLNDRLANKGEKDFELKTNGDLIITNNKLQRKGVSEVAPDSDDNALKNQSANIKLTSTKGQVSIRKNSDITTNGSISLNGHTNASVSTSTLNAGKDINLNAGTKVTVGNVNEDGTTGRNSVLNAGGNINLLAKGNVNDPTDPNNIKGIAIVGAEFNGNDINTVAENGDIRSTSGIFNARNNNKIEAKNGKAILSRSNITAAKNNNITASKNVTVQNNSNIAAETSDITAGTYVYLKDSNVKTKGNNNLTANGTASNDYVEIANSTVESENGDITITQLATMNINNQIYNGSALKSGGNINLYANGTGSNITASNLDALTYNGRLNLTAANDIALDSQNAWYVDRVTFNAGHNTLINSAKSVTTDDVRFNSANENTIAAVTDILINNAMDIQTGKTTLTTTTGTIKTETNNGVINANKNKLIANAGTEINIAFTGVDNKNKGLEINSNVDTHITDKDLNGKNVTLTAKDGKIAIAKLKSDNLTITQPAQILAATDNKANAATDNISADTPNSFKNKAYIEIKGLAGWNMDKNITDTENMPPFYNENQHFDLNDETGYHQKHFITFDGTEDFMLVYKRTGKDCIIPPEPDNPVVDVDTALSTYTKLPKHEEGVSAVAPVLNEITDPTANVIMAAARLSLDEENENDEEDKF